MFNECLKKQCYVEALINEGSAIIFSLRFSSPRRMLRDGENADSSSLTLVTRFGFSKIRPAL